MPELTRPAAPEVLGRLDPSDVGQVHALVQRATAADGTAPLSEHVLLHLPRGGDEEVRNLLVRGPGDGVLAYAQIVATLTPARASGVRFRLDDTALRVPREDGSLTEQPLARQDYAGLSGAVPASPTPSA